MHLPLPRMGSVVVVGNSLKVYLGWRGGRGDVLRGSHGDVAGEKSGASFVERSASEHGNRSCSACAVSGQLPGRAGSTVDRSGVDGAEPP